MDNEIVKLPELAHIGVVVKDLDKAMENYTSLFGLGPWRVRELSYPEVLIHGKKTAYTVRIAFTKFGSTELELMQPTSGKSLYSEFLDERKEGLHHLAFSVSGEEKERILKILAGKGVTPLQNCKAAMHSGSIAYMSTEKTDGVMFEFIHHPPE